MNFQSFKPSSKIFFGVISVVLVAAIIILVVKPASKAERDINQPIDPAFAAYVSGYTAGVISKNSNIIIELANEIGDEVNTGEPISKSLFRFSPGIPGKAYWLDNKTIEYRPDEPLLSGEKYLVKFKLSELMEVPDNLGVFEYVFQTIIQNYDVSFDGLKIYEENNLKRQKLQGIITTADDANESDVEKMLAATQDNRTLNISWNHFSGENKHQFIIEEVERKEDPETVNIIINGQSIGVDKSEELGYDVPALGDFRLMNVSVVHTPEQYVLLKFSDPIQDKQDLNGLVGIEGLSGLKFIISENELLVFPNVRQAGQKKVRVSRNIRNILGYKLQEAYSEDVMFEQIKPGVRFVGKGSILPSTEGLIQPFEAVSLKAVDVSVYKIYENNITQFLQVNNYNGTNQLRRVAVPVVKKTIRLDNTGLTDLSKWNRYTLDLNDLIQKEPGAIYQVKLNFRKSHSAYFCEGDRASENNITEITEDENWDSPGSESSYWDSYEDYYSYDDYDWRERDNPCHSSYYYGSRHVVTKNILASDFGLLAKRGEKGELLVVVTDLKTAQPYSGVNIEIYDYQKQIIGTGISGSEGIANIPLEKKPFLLVATQNKQRGYLKLDDGNALSMSNFNVAGQVVQNGVKGFVYGERGVWRPGDSLHISFILEDKQKILPASHPVVFELLTPTGQLETRLVKSESVNGIYYFGAKTDVDAPTGNWQARIKVGGAQFNKSLKVETIKPNRLKINLDFGVERITKSDKSIAGDLEVKWLHGAIAKNLRAVFDVRLSPVKTTFEKYPFHSFDDPSREFYSETVEVFDGNLDDQGRARINVGIETDTDPPGALNAYFSGRVYEEGGDFSVDRFSIPYYPYASFVGVRLPEGDSRGMLLTDTTHNVDVVTLNSDGTPISRDDLTVEVYKLDWRWWWDQSSGNANFISRRYREPVSKSKVSTKNGRGIAKVRVNHPKWGRFYVRVCDPVSNHCAGKVVYFDWPGWAGRGKRDIPGGATMLTISSDKEKYNVGEKIKVTLPGSKNGRAFVSVENGSKVIDNFWVNTSAEENSFEIDATEEMSPNAYVNVSLMQPHNQTHNDLPVRLYGVTGFKVENPNTHLSPQIQMPDVLEPGAPVSMKISEASGKPMAYTIAVVDDGILDLTRFQTPDPYSSFYAKEALGVKTWDLFDDVIGAYGGRIERLLAIGGDLEIKEEDSKAKRFEPVVKYLGPFYLDKGKTASHKYIMPQYVGSVRTMVIAADKGAYGSVEKTTPVRQPLMVLATLPRVLGPGESFRLPVNVFAMENGLGKVEVEIKPNKYLIVKGSKTKELYFSEEGDKIVEFEVDVLEATGIGKVEIIARGKGKTATQNIELDVRNANPPSTEIIEAVIEPGKVFSTVFNSVGIEGTNEASIEVSNIPPINLEKRLKYLIRFPHGCIEQTVSSAFPQLYLTDFVDLPDEGKAEIETHIKEAIERLKKFQTMDGGFAYWPGKTVPSEWGSNYAGHFILEAAKKGYSVPNSMLRQWKGFQKKHANAWRRTTEYRRGDLMQSYRLYTLALAGSPALGAMNRMREDGNYSVPAGWRLAAAYALAGQPEAGREIVKSLSTDVEEYREMSYTFGSRLRDKAMILEAMLLLEEKEKGAQLLIEISKALSSNNFWMSTQETAYSLIAVGKFVGAEKRSSQLNTSYTFNGNTEEGKTERPFFAKELNITKGQNKLDVKNNGSGTVYVRVLNTGIPIAGDEKEISNHISLDIKYRNSKNEIIDPSKLGQGDDFFIDVTVSNIGYKGHLKEMALSQIFPSGWEIINARMDETGNLTSASQFDYQDIRDDRIYTYFDLPSNKRKTFKVKAIAAYSGRFYLPAISCEAMYDNSVSSQVKGRWVEVVSDLEQ